MREIALFCARCSFAARFYILRALEDDYDDVTSRANVSGYVDERRHTIFPRFHVARCVVAYRDTRAEIHSWNADAATRCNLQWPLVPDVWVAGWPAATMWFSHSLFTPLGRCELETLRRISRRNHNLYSERQLLWVTCWRETYFPIKFHSLLDSIGDDNLVCVLVLLSLYLNNQKIRLRLKVTIIWVF